MMGGFGDRPTLEELKAHPSVCQSGSSLIAVESFEIRGWRFAAGQRIVFVGAITDPSQFRAGQVLRFTDKSLNVKPGEMPRIMIGTVLPNSWDEVDGWRGSDRICFSRDEVVQGDPIGDQSKEYWSIDVGTLLDCFDVEVYHPETDGF